MEFSDVLKTRRSIRFYSNKQVEEQKLTKILEAVNSAPSAGNLQAYEIVIVREPKIKEKLMYAAWGQKFILQAPINLIFFANPEKSAHAYGKRGEELFAIQDATIAASYAQLAAVDLGLGSVWVGSFDDAEVNEITNAPHNLKPVAIIPIGYYERTSTKTPRREIKEFMNYESF